MRNRSDSSVVSNISEVKFVRCPRLSAVLKLGFKNSDLRRPFHHYFKHVSPLPVGTW